MKPKGPLIPSPTDWRSTPGQLHARSFLRLVSRNFLGSHTLVLIDTAVWIYHFERHAWFGSAAGKIIESLEAGRFRAVASELTLLDGPVPADAC